MSHELTHIDADGKAHMVDVSAKPESIRTAVASGFIKLQAETLDLIDRNAVAKGNVLLTAQLAGIQAAKQTSTLIPLCHQLQLQQVAVDFQVEPHGIRITSSVITIGRTGAEMEALTAVSIAGLTIYDMCKAVDHTMEIGEIRLVKKSKELTSSRSDNA
jgi:cyclic pyranopterin monophosphate synthase